jgi:hypothetical protein
MAKRKLVGTEVILERALDLIIEERWQLATPTHMTPLEIIAWFP